MILLTSNVLFVTSMIGDIFAVSKTQTLSLQFPHSLSSISGQRTKLEYYKSGFYVRSTILGMYFEFCRKCLQWGKRELSRSKAQPSLTTAAHCLFLASTSSLHAQPGRIVAPEPTIAVQTAA
jgi:hypothetical protein